jgi:hypothetical protein
MPGTITMLSKTLRRFEFKYRFPARIQQALQSDISSYLPHDFYSDRAPGKFYPVRTLYYDTPSLCHYHEKEDGLEEKTKFRLRCYHEWEQEQTPVFLEIKRKRDANISKQRIAVPWQELPHILDNRLWNSLQGGFVDDVQHAVISKFSLGVHGRGLRPTVLVRFQRQAWQLPDRTDYLRVTIDRSLSAGLSQSVFDSDYTEAHLIPTEMILEVKFNHRVPYWIYMLLQKYGLTREAICKYYLSGDALGIAGERLSSFTKEGRWTASLTF